MASPAAATTTMAYPSLRASWDLNPSPKLTNPNANRPPRPSRPPTLLVDTPPRTAPTVPSRKQDLPVNALWNSHDHRSGQGGKPDEISMGCEWWLPVSPEVKRPRSIYNAASLAYLGDCIYELYARRHFLFPPVTIDEYNERVMSIVRCEAQDALLKKLLDEDYLTEEERDVLRWGKNIGSSKTRTKKRAGVAVYNRASSLETLIGYLYLTNMKRLENLMYNLGFLSTTSSDVKIPKKTTSAAN